MRRTRIEDMQIIARLSVRVTSKHIQVCSYQDSLMVVTWTGSNTSHSRTKEIHQPRLSVVGGVGEGGEESEEMRTLQRLLLLSCLVLSAFAAVQVVAPLNFGISSNPSYVKTADCPLNAGSALFNVSFEGDLYHDSPLQILVLNGSHYEAGYCYGYLAGEKMVENFDTLFNNLIPKTWERDALEWFFDFQYDKYLSQQLPQAYKDEITGVAAGGKDIGAALPLDVLYKRALVLSSFPDDVENNIEWLLYDELQGEIMKGLAVGENKDKEEIIIQRIKSLKDTLKAMKKFLGKTCSMMAVWGDRTSDGSLYAMRNLDWSGDTGISKDKLVTVWRLTDEIPYATISFAAVPGAIAGFSSAGLGVHEAGLNNEKETLEGFAWTLRLRDIMSKATSLDSAIVLFNSTNNTMAVNHMLSFQSSSSSSSSSAPSAPSAPGAVVMETRAGYTAMFSPNDPREADLEMDGFTFGYPLANALWRTNHAYDPDMRKYTQTNLRPHSDTEIRYLLIHHELQVREEVEKRPLSLVDVVNITALAGAKMVKDFYSCSQGSGPVVGGGYNVISAIYHHAASTVYLSYESGSGSTYRSANCGVYVPLNLQEFFETGQPPTGDWRK